MFEPVRAVTERGRVSAMMRRIEGMFERYEERGFCLRERVRMDVERSRAGRPKSAVVEDGSLCQEVYAEAAERGLSLWFAARRRGVERNIYQWAITRGLPTKKHELRRIRK